jgi:hypothetical protein
MPLQSQIVAFYIPYHDDHADDSNRLSGEDL